MRSSKPINPYYEPIPDIEKESKRKSLKRIIRKIINHFKKQPTKFRPLQNELYLFYEEQIREIDAREAQAKEAQAKEAQAKEAQAKEELVETELVETEPAKVELQLPSNERDPFLFFFARVALGELKYPEKPIFKNYCNEEQPTPSSETENPYQEALKEINMKYDTSKEIRLKRDPFDLPMGVFDLDVEVDPIKREVPPMNFNSFDGTKVDHSKDEEQLAGDKHFFDRQGNPIRFELGGPNSSIPSLMPARTKIIVGVSAKKVQKVQSSKALSDSQYPNQKEQKQQELPIQVKNEESPAHDGLPDKESTQAKLDNTPPSSPISSMNRSNLKGLHESPISTYTGNTSPLMKPVFIKSQEILITNITQQKQEQQNNILDEVSIDNCDSNLKDDNNLPLISVFPKHYNLKYKRKYESTNKSHTTISPSKTSLMPSFMDFLNF